MEEECVYYYNFLNGNLFGLIILCSLWLLIVLVFLLNIFKQAVRGPVVALMPDMIPGEIRSEANGVINTMGGIATIVGTVGLARLMDVPITVKGTTYVNILAFPTASILVIAAVILLFIFVKEKDGNKDEDADEKHLYLKA